MSKSKYMAFLDSHNIADGYIREMAYKENMTPLFHGITSAILRRQIQIEALQELQEELIKDARINDFRIIGVDHSGPGSDISVTGAVCLGVKNTEDKRKDLPSTVPLE